VREVRGGPRGGWGLALKVMHYGQCMRMNKGPRIATTVRLPFDHYREAAQRAKGRNWSLSDYVGWCVAKEVDPKNTRDRATGGSKEYLPPLEASDA